jgi:hypothetical protein
VVSSSSRVAVVALLVGLGGASTCPTFIDPPGRSADGDGPDDDGDGPDDDDDEEEGAGDAGADDVAGGEDEDAAADAGDPDGADAGAGDPDGADAGVDDGDEPGVVDAGTGDPDGVDAGAQESGVVDGGVVDAGEGGPGVVDAGVEDAGAGGGGPRPPAELLVLTANVENLPRTSDGCPGDFRDLYAYLAAEDLAPDVFLVQQLSGQDQLVELLGLLGTTLGRAYDGRVAEASPVPFQSPCGVQKERQTNAVVFARDRLALAEEPVVRPSYKNVDGACVLDGLSRTRTIAALLVDQRTGATLSATSLHWSTRNGPGADPACATANARELDQILRVHHGGAALFLAGGDTNEPDLVTHTAASALNPWYALQNVDVGGALGWIDPVWRRCADSGALRACVLDQWTFRGASDRRIDFVFVRGGGAPAVLDAHTITFDEAGDADRARTGSDSTLGYSDHRAVWARVRY